MDAFEIETGVPLSHGRSELLFFPLESARLVLLLVLFWRRDGQCRAVVTMTAIGKEAKPERELEYSARRAAAQAPAGSSTIHSRSIFQRAV